MSTLYRLVVINFTMARYGLDEIILSIHLFRPLRFLGLINPFNWFRSKSLSQGERLRLCIESLGPIFIKFGQMLATRRDLLGEDIVVELEKLLDQVPPFPLHQARRIVEQELGKPIEQAFSSFDENVLASASIAQVYSAVLPAGESVVVKIVRPNIEARITRDIQLLMVLARLADRYWKEASRVKPIKIVEEFEKTLLNELDLVREAANASELRRHFTGSNDLYVPQVYWDYCKTRVMVMERIEGIPVSDIEQLKAHNINLEVLSRKGVEVFFTQVYQNNYFHADMHPGNIFVITTDPDKPKYAAVDFGIVGTLSPEDQRYLAQNFLAFFDRDYHRIAKLHLESGWVPASTRVDQLETAVRTVCEPIFNKPLSEISFAQVLMRLFRVAQRFNVEIQPQMILLHKTLFNIEGLGRQLYPQLDLWKTAHPVLKRWMDEQIGARAVLKDFRENLPQLRDALRELPAIIQHLGEQVSEGQMNAGPQPPDLRQIQEQLATQQRQRYWLTIAATAIVSGMLVLTSGSLPELAWPLLAAGALAAFAARP